MWVCVVLGVRVPATSLFHDEKFAFFDFEVRGTPKILKIFLGVPPKFLKKVGVLPDGVIKYLYSPKVCIPPYKYFKIFVSPGTNILKYMYVQTKNISVYYFSQHNDPSPYSSYIIFNLSKSAIHEASSHLIRTKKACHFDNA